MLFTNSTNYTIGVDGVKISICSTTMRDDPAYTRDYILLANFIVMAFIPFLILTVINSMLYQTITRSTAANKRSNNRQKRDQNIAMILVGIVVVFVICNIFRIVINLYEVLIINNNKNWQSVCFRYFTLQYTGILRKTGQNGKFMGPNMSGFLHFFLI